MGHLGGDADADWLLSISLEMLPGASVAELGHTPQITLFSLMGGTPGRLTGPSPSAAKTFCTNQISFQSCFAGT